MLWHILIPCFLSMAEYYSILLVLSVYLLVSWPLPCVPYLAVLTKAF